MPLRLCLGLRDENCDRLTNDPTSRCPDHKRRYEAARRPNRPTARQRGYTTDYERQRTQVLARSRVCWICGHGGADQADHVDGVAAGTGPLRPAHGTAPCPTCGRRCNQSRGNRDLESS